ncbi:hypothetical protein H5410_005167 [Solanum commersonii]|uniref:Uncharacterized protein n=1 Tax=Solanum commersonii TaxID=4109 RepID=A0A9J6A5W5_SOLCO|nr:hypothetical protein H5410_005167 [Solanum commersonii]
MQQEVVVPYEDMKKYRIGVIVPYMQPGLLYPIIDNRLRR